MSAVRHWLWALGEETLALETAQRKKKPNGDCGDLSLLALEERMPTTPPDPKDISTVLKSKKPMPKTRRRGKSTQKTKNVRCSYSLEWFGWTALIREREQT